MKKLKIFLIASISLILIASVIFVIVYIASNNKKSDNPIDDNTNTVIPDSERIEISSSQNNDFNSIYYTGDEITLKITLSINKDINVNYSFDEKNNIKELTIENNSYSITNDTITVTSTLIETGNFKTDSFTVYAQLKNETIAYTVPSYTWDFWVTEAPVINDTVETKLDHYEFRVASSVDESDNITKALTKDNIIVEEYYYTSEESLNSPVLVLEKLGSIEATSIVPLADNYYLARYIFTFKDIFKDRMYFGFKETLDNSFDLPYYASYVDEKCWNKCLISKYSEDYIDLSKYSHEVQDFTDFEKNGIIIKEFGFKNNSKVKFIPEENKKVIANKNTMNFYDGTYENIYSIFSEEEFKYFVYWNYGLFNANEYLESNYPYSNFLKITNHMKFSYYLRGRWLVTKDIKVSNFVDETIIQKYLDGDTTIKFNEQIFNYSVILDGIFDFDNHTIKYENLDYDSTVNDDVEAYIYEHFNGSEDKYVDDVKINYKAPILFDMADDKNIYLTFENYKTFTNYLTAISNLSENLHTIDNENYFIMENFVQDNRYLLFNCVNDNSVKNINYDYSSLNITAEEFEKVLMAGTLETENYLYGPRYTTEYYDYLFSLYE